MGEAFLDLALMAGHQPYKFSIHLTASTSLTFPRYLLVVERLACLRMTLLTISTGTPDLEAKVAAWRLRSCDAPLTFIVRHL